MYFCFVLSSSHVQCHILWCARADLKTNLVLWFTYPMCLSSKNILNTTVMYHQPVTDNRGVSFTIKFKVIRVCFQSIEIVVQVWYLHGGKFWIFSWEQYLWSMYGKICKILTNKVLRDFVGYKPISSQLVKQTLCIVKNLLQLQSFWFFLK